MNGKKSIQPINERKKFSKSYAYYLCALALSFLPSLSDPTLTHMHMVLKLDSNEKGMEVDSELQVNFRWQEETRPDLSSSTID